jgi:hypothetical protein
MQFNSRLFVFMPYGETLNSKLRGHKMKHNHQHVQRQFICRILEVSKLEQNGNIENAWFPDCSFYSTDRPADQYHERLSLHITRVLDMHKKDKDEKYVAQFMPVSIENPTEPIHGAKTMMYFWNCDMAEFEDTYRNNPWDYNERVFTGGTGAGMQAMVDRLRKGGVTDDYIKQIEDGLSNARFEWALEDCGNDLYSLFKKLAGSDCIKDFEATPVLVIGVKHNPVVLESISRFLLSEKYRAYLGNHSECGDSQLQFFWPFKDKENKELGALIVVCNACEGIVTHEIAQMRQPQA